jgi:hypothetical protein
MSDTNTDTDTNTNNDAINNKKNKNTNGPNVGGFILYYTLGLLGIILWVLFGTTWLYISKLAKSGIPTDTKYEPYTCDINPELGKNPDGTKITVPMNTVYELGMKGLAFWQILSDTAINKWQQEATIETREFIDSFKDTLIEEMRDSANIKGTGPAASTGLSKFWSIILNNTAARGFRSYDMFSIKSDKISDSLKIIVYGLFGLILFPFIWLINGFCSAWYVIKAALFNENLDNMNDGGADNILDSIGSLKYLDTDDAGAFGIKNWPKSIGRGILWLIIWMFIFPVLTFFVLPVYSTFMPFFKMLFSGSYTLKVDNKFYNSNEHTDSKSFWDFVKDTFAYKRTLLLLLSVLNLFTCANTYLGQNYLGAVVIAVIFATIFGNIFVDTKPEDNTMIFQDPMAVPQKPPVRKQPHKVCMFPKDINRIDKELRKLNSDLLEQITRAKGVSMSQETQDLFNNLKSMSKSINNEFTDVSLSDDKSVIDKFEKKIEQDYGETIKKFVSSLDADIAAAPPSIFSSTSSDIGSGLGEPESRSRSQSIESSTSSDIGSDVSSDIAAGLSEPGTRSRSQSIESNISTGTSASAESNVSAESNISSETNVGSQNVDPALFYKLTDFIKDRDQPKKIQLSPEDEAEMQETFERTKTRIDTEAAEERAKQIQEGAKIRAEMEALLAKGKAERQSEAEKTSKQEDIFNPIVASTSIGTPGQEMIAKPNISQENIIPTSNTRESIQLLNPQDIKERTAQTSSSEDIFSPILASTSIGTPGQEMTPKPNISQGNISQGNISPDSNDIELIQFVKPEVIKERTAQTSSSEETFNPMFASGKQENPMRPVSPTSEYLKSKGIPTEGVVNQQRISEALRNAAAEKQAKSKQLVPQQLEPGRRTQLSSYNTKNARISKKVMAEEQAAAERQEAERLNTERLNAERLEAQRLAAQRLAVDREAEAKRQAEAKAKRQAEAKQAISNINFQENIDLQKQALDAQANRLNQEPPPVLKTEEDYRKEKNKADMEQLALAFPGQPAKPSTNPDTRQNDLIAQQLALMGRQQAALNKKGGSNKNRTLKKREQNIKIRLV